MTTLDWMIFVSIVGAVLMLLLTLFFLIEVITGNRKLKKLLPKRCKNKKKRRQVTLQRKKKRQAVLCVLLAGMLSCLSVYVSNYQATTLFSGDAQLLAHSYQLIREFRDQLALAGEKTGDSKELREKIRSVSTNLASYGIQSVNTQNNSEGRMLLTHYYNALSELGVNASSQINYFYGNQELIVEYQADIERVIRYETKVFKFYKIDESELKNVN